MDRMRLFIALNLDRGTKSAIESVQRQLRNEAKSGIFSPPELFHMTMAFLGEVDEERVEDIFRAIARTGMKPIPLVFDRVGRFRREEGDIWWVGPRKNAGLERIQKELTQNLRQEGFLLEQRSFQPHVTLGRRILLRQGAASIKFSPIEMEADSLHLMQSRRIEGVLTYTEIKKRH